MNLDDCPVNEGIFEVGVTTHGVEKTFEYTRLGPATEPPELAVPVAKTGRQVAPRLTGPNAPEDCLEKQPIVPGCHATIAGLARQLRLKPHPQIIRNHEPFFNHSNLHFGNLNQKSNSMGIPNVHGP